jgi:hypothetical protein
VTRRATTKTTREKRPLDDRLRWLPIAEALSRIEQHTGSGVFAVRELTDLVANDKIGTMHRLPTGEPRRLQPSFWRTPESKLIFVFARNTGSTVNRDGVFYVWAPDLDKLYPTASPAEQAAADAAPGERPVTARRRGPKPQHDWRRQVGREVARRAIAGDAPPTATAMLNFCRDEWGWDWQPDPSHMGKLISDLRFLFDD